VLLLGLAGCAGAAPVSVPAEALVVRRIALEETLTRLDAGEDVIFLDTRERAIGPMIQDAVHVPYSWLGKWAKEQPKDAFIIAYCACANEASAARAVLDLQREGFTNTYALLGGFDGWVSAGRPVEVRR